MPGTIGQVQIQIERLSVALDIELALDQIYGPVAFIIVSIIALAITKQGLCCIRIGFEPQLYGKTLLFRKGPYTIAFQVVICTIKSHGLAGRLQCPAGIDSRLAHFDNIQCNATRGFIKGPVG